MILTHHGIDSIRRRSAEVEIVFQLVSDAPYYEGTFENVYYGDSLISKAGVNGDNVNIWFTSDKSPILTKNFSLEFDKLCYSPSNSFYANHLELMRPKIMLQRGHHEYVRAIGNKNQVVASATGYTSFSPATLAIAGSMTDNPFIITQDLLYTKLYRVKVVGVGGSKIEIYIDGIKLAECDKEFDKVTYLNFGNEVYFPIACRNFKLTYIL